MNFFHEAVLGNFKYNTQYYKQIDSFLYEGYIIYTINPFINITKLLCSDFCFLPFQEKIINPFYINRQIMILGFFDFLIKPQIAFAEYHNKMIKDNNKFLSFILAIPRSISFMSVFFIRSVLFLPMLIANLLFNSKMFLSYDEYKIFYENFFKDKQEHHTEIPGVSMSVLWHAEEKRLADINNLRFCYDKEISLYNHAIGLFGYEKQKAAENIYLNSNKSQIF